jgi:hypothetical protein
MGIVEKSGAGVSLKTPSSRYENGVDNGGIAMYTLALIVSVSNIGKGYMAMHI